MSMPRLFAAAAFVLLTALIAVPRGFAADMSVGVQLALFEKMWKLDRNFAARDVVKIAVLYEETNAESTAMKDAAVAWMASRQNFRASPVALDAPNGVAALRTVDADAFYVTRMRDANVWDVAKVARARDIRTMTGVQEYVRRGLSVAISARNDRPQIILNLDAARAEGAAYQAQLLRLTNIVRD